MNRFSRISTIWRKEFADTLRDRRTVIAMVFVPIVLYPALMLGSLQAFELQVSRLKQEVYTIAVPTEDVGHWLRTRILDPDPARHPSASGVPAEELTATMQAEPHPTTGKGSPTETARTDVRHRPPPYQVKVFADVKQAVFAGRAHVGLLVEGDHLPRPDAPGSARITLVLDEAEIRSQIAAAGLEAVLERANDRFVARRLKELGLDESFVRPLELNQFSVATPEKLSGSMLGQLVALFLVIMTITGAIYPAIDLTAGERERGTLETLMAAPVPRVDLIAGKFVVVASIGMLSAVLNLLSIGGTIYFGGLGDALAQGQHLVIPLRTLPLVLVVLIPLAIMFSALLLAVCSFARSFKEAQNYIMPVMFVALVPAVIGLLPGAELEGPLLIMPVTNIVILTRELFMGQIEPMAVIWVTVSTCFYAGAAAAVATKLFGQEAVLFADSSTIRTLFQRRFFKPSDRPTTSQAFLLLALVYSLNFFVQQSLLKSGVAPGSTAHLAGVALTLAVLFVALPIAASGYLKVRLGPALALRSPPPRALVAGACFGLATWVLALAWLTIQERLLPLPPELVEAAQPLDEQLRHLPLPAALFFVALVPGFCEELFFRGYALSGLRGGLGKVLGVLLVALAFGASHYSAHRLVMTSFLGLLLGLLVVQYRSIWPAILAHMMHNSLILLVSREDGLLPWLQAWGFVNPETQEVFPPLPWLLGASLLVALGIALCLKPRVAETRGRTSPAGGKETTSQAGAGPGVLL